MTAVWSVKDKPKTPAYKRIFVSKRYLEDQGVDGNILLKWIFKNWNGETQNALTCEYIE